MVRRWIAVLALLGGCNSGGEARGDGDSAGDGGSSSGTTGPLPSPYAETGDDGIGEDPTLQPDVVASTATAGLQALLAVKPQAVVTAYESLFEFEDGCPESFTETTEGGRVLQQWFTGTCTTSSGVTISGGGFFERATGVVEEGRTSDAVSLFSDGPIRLAASDGRWFELDGGIEYSHSTGDGASDSSLTLTGEASADPMTAGSSPLLDGSLTANVTLFIFEADGYRQLGGAGALTGSVLGQAKAMSFNQFFVDSGECSEPGGTVAVRGSQGYWHDVVFDAVTYGDGDEPVVDMSLCDGCGKFFAGGTENGTACVSKSDLDALLTWETQPW